MTRTARSAYPSAIAKDRSEAKNGMDKHIPKGGAGPHNWGRLEDEYELESAALEDEQDDFEETTGKASVNHDAERPKTERRGSSLTPEEVQQGLEFRKNALKSPFTDLGSIARTAPAISTSPSQSSPIVADADTDKLKTA
ncbi:hypothetical protein C8Q78DRAFT_1077719 [Trametes maxima]|nr:hypothetical protein C8Q78DRAFT_1077719 [Trametes maxima]